MSSAYIIANVRVTNPEQYAEYRKWSSAAFEAHNAEICVRGGQVEVLEGGAKLNVKGSVAFLSKTQVWSRVK